VLKPEILHRFNLISRKLLLEFKTRRSFMKKISWLALPLLLASAESWSEEKEEEVVNITPNVAFANHDYTWLNGNSRQKTFPLAGKVFNGQLNLDANYVYDFARPKDHTLVGSTNSGRTSEIQVQQIGIGGDFYHQRIRGRLMSQFGMYSTMTPRNDASPSRGQWNLSDAYRYFSEAYGGYQLTEDLSVDVGIFMSYIGLCSYYNYENWVYQMSYVSANTPWFFNGARLNHRVNDNTAIEYWLINGWQSYGMYNEMPGLGIKVQHRPNANWSFVTNDYFGADTLNQPGRQRLHSDSSLQWKYWEKSNSKISRSALSLTVDAGCESGGGADCGKQNFLGFMFYNRMWFGQKHALTLGGGAINNPGRYLALMPAINGATASSGTPYFTANPGDRFSAWDSSATFDYMPSELITFRTELNHREASVPYFAGRGGITPQGGNQGTPGSSVTGFQPDLRRREERITLSMMIRL
jgi:hypothetical protein